MPESSESLNQSESTPLEMPTAQAEYNRTVRAGVQLLPRGWATFRRATKKITARLTRRISLSRSTNSFSNGSTERL